MKVTQLSLKMLLDSMIALDHAEEDVRTTAEHWLRLQKDRERGWAPDADTVYFARADLEIALGKYREQLAHTYDLMGDKGLVNFTPTGELVLDE